MDLSGGEKKRNETLQLGVLSPKIAILDEFDSGLDVDALRQVSRRIEQATDEVGLEMLTELKPDRVHVLVRGTIQHRGGPELATELEESGYVDYVDEPEPAVGLGLGPDPFAPPPGLGQ